MILTNRMYSLLAGVGKAQRILLFGATLKSPCGFARNSNKCQPAEHCRSCEPGCELHTLLCGDREMMLSKLAQQRAAKFAWFVFSRRAFAPLNKALFRVATAGLGL